MGIGYMAKRKEHDDEFDDFMGGLLDDDSITHTGARPIDNTRSAPKRASAPFVPTITHYHSWVLYTTNFIKFAMNQMKTQDGLLALYNKIQEHYDKIPNQAKTPKPPDEKTTDFPMTDILSDTNYIQISNETELVSHLSYCLSSLDLMCQALLSNNSDIYNIYNKILSGWLTMIKNETEKKTTTTVKKTTNQGR